MLSAIPEPPVLVRRKPVCGQHSNKLSPVNNRWIGYLPSLLWRGVPRSVSMGLHAPCTYHREAG